MRILNVNAAVVPIEPRSWEEVHGLEAYEHAGQLNAVTSQRLIDFDVFLIDPATMPHRDSSAAESISVSTQALERVTGGGFMVLFGADGRMGWLPAPLPTRTVGGTRIEVIEGQGELSAFVHRHLSQMSYEVQFERVDRGSRWPRR